MTYNKAIGKSTHGMAQNIPADCIGGTLLDEVVVNAQNRQNLRSGGR